tara:strand:- start:2767 stop:3147 length:381 start_codon:yes stop_codon:yes gene_type:complete
MAKVLVNEFYQHGWEKPKRTYAVYGGLWPPALATFGSKKYIMPGWYELPEEDHDIKLEDIAFYPYKPKKDNIPNIDSNAIYKVKSSRGDKEYLVQMNASGSLECECPGYGFRRRCRHIDQVHKEHL